MGRRPWVAHADRNSHSFPPVQPVICCLVRTDFNAGLRGDCRAYGGGSTVWVFSTTLLQRYSDDKFRGRVFAADLGFCMLLIAVSGYIASVAIDWGIGVRTVAFFTGVAMLVPALAWLWAMRLWREEK
jgi:hypothetical protein